MKQRFIDRCVDTVISNICLNNIRFPIQLQLEEVVSSSQVPDDFNHSMQLFMSNSTRKNEKVVVDNLNLSDRELIGKAYLSEIYERLSRMFHSIPSRKDLYQLELADKQTADKSYSGRITIKYKE